MKYYDVKISGEGTLSDIIESLENILEVLEHSRESEYITEDSVLIAEIKRK